MEPLGKVDDSSFNAWLPELQYGEGEGAIAGPMRHYSGEKEGEMGFPTYPVAIPRNAEQANHSNPEFRPAHPPKFSKLLDFDQIQDGTGDNTCQCRSGQVRQLLCKKKP